MRPLQNREDTSRRLRRRLRVGPLLLALTALAVTAAPAAAKINKADFAKFVNCPVEKGAALCTYGETLSGEFKMGSKAVAISNPIVLQGGLASAGFGTYPIIPARFGVETMQKVSQPIPGGLTGISEEIGGPTSATSEVAGPPEIIEVTPFALAAGTGAVGEGLTAVKLPLKIHLENKELGENCYIGSDEEPIVLELTDGKTHPPAGTEPIEGKRGNVIDMDKDRLIMYEGNTLVDNGFAVPAAKNCGTSALTEAATTAAVNAAAGLPSAAGKNYAILNGNFFTTFKQWAEKYAKPPKVKKTKK